MDIEFSPLITQTGLASALQSDQGLVVFDCRFDLANPEAGREAYANAHVPGALYADLDQHLSTAPGPEDGRHPLPDRAQFRAWLGKQGVGPQTRVVAYDDASGAFAARLWWLLKWLGHDHAAVLSGGMATWQASGLTTSSDVPSRLDVGSYPENGPNPAMVASAAAIPDELAAGNLLVDVRAPERYSGATEPLDPVAGHVPGAVNFPFQNNLDAAGLFRDADTIRAQLVEFLDGQPSEQVIAMCGSGVTACHLLLAMEAVGLYGARLYPGSWSEWIRDPKRPTASGPEPFGTAAD
ncbi:MAG: sulfurtransferase [Gammaproteobacteria bacterium]